MASPKPLVLVWIAFDDGFLFYTQRRLRGLHVFPDGGSELPGEPSKFDFVFQGESTLTKDSNSIAQLFDSRFA
jgi:hypothetical protein